MSPERVGDADGTTSALPTLPPGAGDGFVAPPVAPAERTETGMGETPVAGMGVEGLALVLAPMLAEQFAGNSRMQPQHIENNKMYAPEIDEQYAKDRMMTSLISLSRMCSESNRAEIRFL